MSGLGTAIAVYIGVIIERGKYLCLRCSISRSVQKKKQVVITGQNRSFACSLESSRRFTFGVYAFFCHQLYPPPSSATARCTAVAVWSPGVTDAVCAATVYGDRSAVTLRLQCTCFRCSQTCYRGLRGRQKVDILVSRVAPGAIYDEFS